MKKIKIIKAKHLGSGVFVSEGAAMNKAKVKMSLMEECVVVDEKDWEYIEDQLFRLSTLEH